MNQNNTYRRRVLRQARLIGAAFLVLTVVILIAARILETDATAAVLTGIFGLPLIFARDSWLDF